MPQPAPRSSSSPSATAAGPAAASTPASQDNPGLDARVDEMLRGIAGAPDAGGQPHADLDQSVGAAVADATARSANPTEDDSVPGAGVATAVASRGGDAGAWFAHPPGILQDPSDAPADPGSAPLDHSPEVLDELDAALARQATLALAEDQATEAHAGAVTALAELIAPAKPITGTHENDVTPAAPGSGAEPAADAGAALDPALETAASAESHPVPLLGQQAATGPGPAARPANSIVCAIAAAARRALQPLSSRAESLSPQTRQTVAWIAFVQVILAAAVWGMLLMRGGEAGQAAVPATPGAAAAVPAAGPAGAH